MKKGLEVGICGIGPIWEEIAESLRWPTVIAANLRKLPETKLIGFNPEGDGIIVFSASWQPVLSVEELTRVSECGSAGENMYERKVRSNND
ncbi:hypothetical protein [Sporomusa malonica]|nr:hypothetical protein [Sporomusa malonica]